MKQLYFLMIFGFIFHLGTDAQRIITITDIGGRDKVYAPLVIYEDTNNLYSYKDSLYNEYIKLSKIGLSSSAIYIQLKDKKYLDSMIASLPNYNIGFKMLEVRVFEKNIQLCMMKLDREYSIRLMEAILKSTLPKNTGSIKQWLDYYK